MTGVLTPGHTHRTGSVTLNSSGNATSDYDFNPNNDSGVTNCLVAITSRSIGTLPIMQQSTTVGA